MEYRIKGFETANRGRVRLILEGRKSSVLIYPEDFPTLKIGDWVLIKQGKVLKVEK